VCVKDHYRDLPVAGAKREIMSGSTTTHASFGPADGLGDAWHAFRKLALGILVCGAEYDGELMDPVSSS
jgi:hypothetical protein